MAAERKSRPLLECPRCGAMVKISETHDCPNMPIVASSDGCPMCGEKYESWLDHLLYEH